MNHNPTTLDAYNKYKGEGQGTLIANWFEERELKDATGISRVLPKNHVPKKREDLFTKSPEELAQTQSLQINKEQAVDTNERTLGKRVNDFPRTENSLYGTGRNRADELPRTGMKTQKLDQQFIEQIKQELNEQEQEKYRKANERTFDTTTKVEFRQKDLTEANNTVGRRVMKTQNGEPVSINNRDEDLLCDHGLNNRGQFLTDQQLKEMLPKGESYLTQQPITFWTEKQNDGCFYMSQPKEQNPNSTFHKDNTFLKTYHNYTHVKK